jgi:hypothetical protein
MNWTLRVTDRFVSMIRCDLRRRHSFAAERVGFAFGTTEGAGTAHLLILLNAYEPVAESDYIDDPGVGARISGAGIRKAMQRALSAHLSAFHVHMHEHRGDPSPSRVDRDETPPIVRSLRAAQPAQAHGLLLLSRDVMTAAVWLPNHEAATCPGKVVVVGQPMQHAIGLCLANA